MFPRHAYPYADSDYSVNYLLCTLQKPTGSNAVTAEKYESLKRDYDALAAKYNAKEGVQASKKAD